MIVRRRHITTPEADGTRERPFRRILMCVVCGGQHIDRNEWAERPHHIHRCEHCGAEWDNVWYAYGTAEHES